MSFPLSTHCASKHFCPWGQKKHTLIPLTSFIIEPGCLSRVISRMTSDNLFLFVVCSSMPFPVSKCLSGHRMQSWFVHIPWGSTYVFETIWSLPWNLFFYSVFHFISFSHYYYWLPDCYPILLYLILCKLPSVLPAKMCSAHRKLWSRYQT